jgi:hypothetical protein
MYEAMFAEASDRWARLPSVTRREEKKGLLPLRKIKFIQSMKNRKADCRGGYPSIVMKGRRSVLYGVRVLEFLLYGSVTTFRLDSSGPHFIFAASFLVFPQDVLWLLTSFSLSHVIQGWPKVN